MSWCKVKPYQSQANPNTNARTDSTTKLIKKEKLTKEELKEAVQLLDRKLRETEETKNKRIQELENENARLRAILYGTNYHPNNKE